MSETPDRAPTSPAEDRGSRAAGGASVGEDELRDALRQVVDPEIGMDVVTLGLIRAIHLRPGAHEIEMILTTPFCPYGGILVQQVKNAAEALLDEPVRVELLDDSWSPDMMEGGDWSAWGLT